MAANMEYLSFNQAMKARFGTKVYKLALDGGMTCPNRDGTLGRKGCIFCSDVGSGDFAAPRCGDISAQLAAAKAKVAQKNPNGKYIAYSKFHEHLCSRCLSRNDISSSDGSG